MCGREERSFSPGVELALLGSLFLEDASVFDLDRTGNEANLAALLHQTSYPPVVVEFLQEKKKTGLYEHGLNHLLVHTHTRAWTHTHTNLFDV